MAIKPSEYYEWGSDSLTQLVIVDSTVYLITNKEQPALDLRGNGYDYSEVKGLPLQYWNYQLDGVSKWIQHLDQRYSVGDVFKTFNNLSQATVEAQLGGSWTFLGSVVETPGTFYFWRKTA